MLIAVAIAGIVIATLTVLNPRAGTYFFWVFWMWYPTEALHALLPLNARFDDLYLVFLTLCCVRVAPPNIWSSRALRMAGLWFISIVLGNLVGMLTGPTYVIDPAIRLIGKCAYVPMIVFMILSVVRDERDAKRQILAISIATIGLAALNVTQVYRPELTSMWEVPNGDVEMRNVSETAGEAYADATRRGGASVGTTSTAVIGALMAACGLRMAMRASTLLKQLGYGIAAGAGGLALAYSVTRGATAGLMVAVLYSLVRFPRRLLTGAFIFVVVILMFTQTDLGERWGHRVGDSGSANVLEEGADTRASLWTQYLQEWSNHYFLFGRGAPAEFSRHNAAAHSAYIGAFSSTGLFGAVVLTWVLVSSWQMGRKILRIESEPFYRALGESLLMCLIVLMVYGIVSEVFQGAQPILFALIAMVDLRLRERASRESGDEMELATLPAGESVGPLLGTLGMRSHRPA